MGKIAKLMIDGKMCSTCGVEFVQPHGVPVVCEDCYNQLTRKEKAEVTVATNEEI